MRVKIERESFLKALGQLAGVVPTRSPKPILASVLLETGTEGLVACATDLEVSMSMVLRGAEVQETGIVAMPAALLRGIVAESSGEHVILTTEKNGVTVEVGGSEFTVPTADAAEFPTVEFPDSGAMYVVKASDLKAALAGTTFATDDDNSRYALSGCLFESQDGKLWTVATDGKRLAVAESPCECFGASGPFPTNVIVPEKGSLVFQRIAADADGDCQLTFEGNHVGMVVDGTRVRVRMTEGRFPRWRDVLPKEIPHSVVLLVQEIRSAIRRAMLLATNDSMGISLAFSPGKLVVSKEEKDKGKGRSVVPITYDGPEVTLVMNGKYLQEGLSASNAANVTVGFSDGEGAILLTAGSWQCVVMPMAKAT